MRRRQWFGLMGWMSGFLLHGLCLLPVFAWTITNLEGREYVSFRDLEKFYEFSAGEITPLEVKLQKPNKILHAQVGTRELVLNNLRFYLSLPILRDGSTPMVSRLDLAKVIDPVLRPGRIRGGEIKTIVLDAGHGGKDQGTWSQYGSEKIYTLDVVARLLPLLRAKGLNIALTRRDDSFLSLEDRVLLANKQTDALFVSIHFNAGSEAQGIETYALPPQGVPSSDGKPSLLDFQPCEGNAYDAENIALATAIHGCIMQRIRLRDRGIRRARFHVLKGINMPGVLIEGGYLGGADAYAIAHAQYRQVLAEAIARGILRYIAAVPLYKSPPPRPIPPSGRPPETLPKEGALVQSETRPNASQSSSPPAPPEP